MAGPFSATNSSQRVRIFFSAAWCDAVYCFADNVTTGEIDKACRSYKAAKDNSYLSLPVNGTIYGV